MVAQHKLEEMEKYIGAVFQNISDSAESEEVYSKEKMRKITQ
jgi:hypothetical protein